jgi:hypothetical protein
MKKADDDIPETVAPVEDVQLFLATQMAGAPFPPEDEQA